MTTSNEHNNAPAVPQGYEIHEIPADYSGLVWLEGQVRAVARRAQAATGPQGWTDADSDAARLALELECLLMDTKDLSVVSKWWASANDALELHRQRLAATPAPAPAQEVASAFTTALDIRLAQGWNLTGNVIPVLYTDTINDYQVRRDDVWLCTTDALKTEQEVGLTDEWISVSDRLPDVEPGAPAIEFYNEDLRKPTRQVIGIYRYGEWLSGGHQFSNVTYWKPLTPAPIAALRAKESK